MALLGTLLVSALLANGRLRVQAHRAERRVQACEIADGLLKEWWKKPSELPRSGAGDVKGFKGWKWQTKRIASEPADELKCEVVALEIYGPADEAETPSARVELLLTKVEDEESARNDAD